MLTDIFARRYQSVQLRAGFTEEDRRLMVQSFRICSEQLYPYYVSGNESPKGKLFWTDLHSRLSMELGYTSLSALAYSYPQTWNGVTTTQTKLYPVVDVCKNWMLMSYADGYSADNFIKERLSMIEIAFRIRGEVIAAENAQFPSAVDAATRQQEFRKRTGLRVPGNAADSMAAINQRMNSQFEGCVAELNERFRQANYSLHYHNGFIQFSTDEQIRNEVEQPFWHVVADPKWANVDTDMKEAVDRRDAGGRDPAFYAARALESTIKIISADKGWGHGSEKGAHNFIDNLAKTNAGFISAWEAKILKEFFTSVRNPFGHGPGKDVMPALTSQQTDWAIESCMSWIKNLIKRI